jgi:hypothetical protein
MTPHRFTDGTCVRCAMRSTWPGARQPCEGLAANVELATRTARERRTLRRKALHRRRMGATIPEIAMRFGVSPWAVARLLEEA